MHAETQKDFDTLFEKLADTRIGQAALARIQNDLEEAIRALNTYGIHLSGHGCGSKKIEDACNCGLDRTRERAGLARTHPKDGSKPYPRNSR